MRLPLDLVVVGLVAQALFHAWWLDGVTSLAIVYFLVKEGREAWEPFRGVQDGPPDGLQNELTDDG